jgi:probable addiction module antidote protein
VNIEHKRFEMARKTMSWDAAEILDSPEAIVSYLEAALEENDPALLTHALGVVARAKGVAKIAEATGVTREGLYKALAIDGDPRLSTFIGVLKALGLRLDIKAA